MSRASGVPLEELRPHLFLLRDRDATGHLLRVSGGLDSLVMGEGQILAQVKQVHKVGQNSPGFGRHLNGLFKQAVTAGKRVRAETSISSGAVSVSSAAAELAQLKLPTHDFNDAKVREGWKGAGGRRRQAAGRRCMCVHAASCDADAPLLQLRHVPTCFSPPPSPLPLPLPQVCIIGAGKMSKLLVKHMHSKGCTRMTVLNRSLPRAEALAEEFPEVTFDIHLMHDLMKVGGGRLLGAEGRGCWAQGGGSSAWRAGWRRQADVQARARLRVCPSLTLPPLPAPPAVRGGERPRFCGQRQRGDPGAQGGPGGHGGALAQGAPPRDKGAGRGRGPPAAGRERCLDARPCCCCVCCHASPGGASTHLPAPTPLFPPCRAAGRRRAAVCGHQRAPQHCAHAE